MTGSIFTYCTTKNTYTLRTLFRLTNVIILGEMDSTQKKNLRIFLNNSLQSHEYCKNTLFPPLPDTPVSHFVLVF